VSAMNCHSTLITRLTGSEAMHDAVMRVNISAGIFVICLPWLTVVRVCYVGKRKQQHPNVGTQLIHDWTYKIHNFRLS
jgi:hypothetical protein